jgi:cytoskeletal protein CcmA (bactofilin family)
MFHRVKPETPETQEPQKQQQAPSQATSKPEVKSYQPGADKPQQTPARPEAKQETSTFNQQKDTKSMITDNNEEQSSSEQTGSRPAEIPVGAYRAPGKTPVRTPGGYPGAYPGAAYSTKPVMPGDRASENDRTLTIGSGITMSGEIESCDYLLVEGTVEASLKGASVLEIAESGVFYGTVEIDEATIAGRFEGDITANGRLTIRSTGTITGSIAYKELEVESGAVIDGRLTPVGSASQAKVQGNKNKPQAGKKKEDQPEAANSDVGLFSKTAAE